MSGETISRKLETLSSLINLMDVIGPFFTGDCMMYADIMLAPFALRFDSVLKHYRGFQVSATIRHIPTARDYKQGKECLHLHSRLCNSISIPKLCIKKVPADMERYHVWFDAVKKSPAVAKTMPERQKLVDFYARYADNTAVSAVAAAIRNGIVLP